MQHLYLEEEMLAHVEPLARTGEFPQGGMPTFAASLFQVNCKNPTPQDALKETCLQMKIFNPHAVFCHLL